MLEVGFVFSEEELIPKQKTLPASDGATEPSLFAPKQLMKALQHLTLLQTIKWKHGY